MTLKELLIRNENARKKRELAKKLQEEVKEAEIKAAPVKEETPHVEEVKQEEELVEVKKEEENKVEEAENKPVQKKGKKPANRTYMVVEDVKKDNE